MLFWDSIITFHYYELWVIINIVTEDVAFGWKVDDMIVKRYDERVTRNKDCTGCKRTRGDKYMVVLKQVFGTFVQFKYVQVLWWGMMMLKVHLFHMWCDDLRSNHVFYEVELEMHANIRACTIGTCHRCITSKFK